MQYNLIRTKENSNEQITGFGGLNRLDKPQKNEFAAMKNMSSDHYPCLAPAKAAKTALTWSDEIKAVIAPKYSDNANISTFTGVAGDTFYYMDTPVSTNIPDGDVTLADFNGRIIICVYDGKKSHMLYYDYTASGDGTVKPMEKGVYNIPSCTAYSSGDPQEDFEVINYLEYAGSDKNFKWCFDEGDSVFIEGFTGNLADNNMVQLDSRYQNVSASKAISCIVERVVGNRLYLQLYNRDGNRLVLKGGTGSNINVYTKIPTMNHICIHNNRLWGTNPNGEYIYASKLGDPFNFNTFQGLANDSFYAEIGTAGGFTGIVSYRDNLVAFKREYIHHIYGDKPSNFTIPKQLSDCGCIDIRSAVQIGSMLYFLGYGGFYVYNGGQPQLISQKLDRKYKKAVAMTDGQKYIVSCRGKDGNELLVYDTRYGLWHVEEKINAVGSFRWHDKLYIAAAIGYSNQANRVIEYSSQAPQGWECESVIIHDDIFDNKGMTELWIRARIAEGASIDVSTSEDGGEFLHRGTLKGTGTLKVYRIPIRFINGEFYQYRLDGKGAAVIHSIERVISSGGRQYKGV